MHAACATGCLPCPLLVLLLLLLPLLQVSAFPLSAMFGVCVGFLTVALFCQLHLNAITANEDVNSKHKPPEKAKAQVHSKQQHMAQPDARAAAKLLAPGADGAGPAVLR